MFHRDWLTDILGKGRVSFRVPLVILLMAVGLLPMVIHGSVLSSYVEQSHVSSRSVDVQNQCLILSSKMSRAGYMEGNAQDLSIDTELNVTADLYHGRIVVVDKNYRVVRDTFGLAEGKFVVSEEVIRCFKGENSNHYNNEKNYFIQTFPIYENTPEQEIRGVLVMAASTGSISLLAESVKEESRFLNLITWVVLLMVSLGAIGVLSRPFSILQGMLNKVSEGDLEQDIDEHTYRETREISEAVNRTITKLKVVDQSRQAFVSNVSHELKTPITSIRVLADSLMGMEGAPVELYQEFMADISDEIDRESKIIDDLLSLVKMDKSSSDQINVATMSINSLMEVILKRLRPIAKKRNIEVIFESIREVSADVDEVKISLAFNNLVENAIKYNVDNGWVKVTLDADHKSFSVTVEDSGIGIPEEFREHIFERFYRVDKARSRETGGTGLGLSITKSVILMHKGTIKVESREGEGTTFVVRIPLSYIPSGPKKGGAAISGTPKNSPDLKGFWIGGGLSAKKGQPGADARILGNPAAERKEGRE